MNLTVVDFQGFSFQMLEESHRVMRSQSQVVAVDQDGCMLEVADIPLEEMVHKMEVLHLDMEEHRLLEERQVVVMTQMVRTQLLVLLLLEGLEGTKVEEHQKEVEVADGMEEVEVAGLMAVVAALVT
jgi:hypothetical protein